MYLCTHTNQQNTDPEDEGDEEKDGGSTLKPERPSPEFTTTSTNSQGFLSISAGWEEDQDSREGRTSSSTLWSRVEELPDTLKEKVISLKNERYASLILDYLIAVFP